MFNISFAELIVILILAFIILGPDEMVKVARFCGRLVRKSRHLLWQIKEYVNKEAAETGLDEVKKAADEVRNTAAEADIRRDLKGMPGNVAEKHHESGEIKSSTEKK